MNWQYLKRLVAPKQEKIKKYRQKMFKGNHLSITIQSNLKIVDYLDVTFNFSNGTYRPFCKSSNESHIYIRNETTHHPF